MPHAHADPDKSNCVCTYCINDPINHPDALIFRHGSPACHEHPEDDPDVRGGAVRPAVPKPKCECQYTDDGRLLYGDSDCDGHCKPKPDAKDPAPDACRCGASAHPGHACANPVTVSQSESHIDSRPCLQCQDGIADVYIAAGPITRVEYDGHRHWYTNIQHDDGRTTSGRWCDLAWAIRLARRGAGMGQKETK